MITSSTDKSAKMPPSSKTSVTNFIRDAIKAGQCVIQDRHIVINTQPQIPVVVVHQFPVNNYVAIQIR